MSRRWIAILSLILVAFSYISFIIVYANASYPLVGHDFRYFIPRLLDTFLHYKVNGFSIQWYTPSFGGGLPAYPNPQDTQFTLPQLLMFFIPPWTAVLTGDAIYILIGFWSSYYFFNRILEFSPYASSIGSILFNVNGFVFSHILVGHLGYQAFPLFPLILIALTSSTLQPFTRGVLASLVIAVQVHCGGFYVLVIYLLSCLMIFPFLMLVRPGIFPPRKLVSCILWGILLTTVLTGSKICASLSFLKICPRIVHDLYNVSLLQGIFGIFLQFILISYLLRIAMLSKFSIISHEIFRYKFMTGAAYGLWEFDMSQPLSFFILFVMVAFSLPKLLRRVSVPTKKNLALLILLGIAIWITLELRLADGWVYINILSKLPVLRSLHVNLRYSAAFIFPFALMGAFCFKYLENRIHKGTTLFFLFISLLSLVHLTNYRSLDIKQVYAYKYDIRKSFLIYKDIAKGKIFPIDLISKISDTMAIKNHASSAEPYEPIFGYELENFKPLTHGGPVWDQNHGYFNMTNPASLVFPKQNGLFPFERIKTSEPGMLDNFIQHKQPDWKQPFLQKVLDFLMLSSFILLPILVFGLVCRRFAISLWRGDKAQ